MMLGESPGKEEDARGRVFVGKTGQEVNGYYLPIAGLQRSEVYMTNVVKCRTGNQSPKPEEAAVCSRYWLPREIEKVRPEIIVAMGGIAAGVVRGIDGSDSRSNHNGDSPWSERLDLECHHGFPLLARVYQWQGTVLPTYHPAAGLHKTELMVQLREDFEGLKRVLKGELVGPPKDEYPDPEYKEIKTRGELDEAFDSWWGSRLMAKDTESHGGEPWSVQFSTSPGSAGFINIDCRQVLAHFQSKLMKRSWARWAYHNQMYDRPIEEKLGIVAPDDSRVVDTMMLAYHIGGLPQGLKPLAFRLLGKRMRSYEEVTGPYARAAQLEYLAEAVELGKRLPEPEQEMIVTKKGTYQMGRKLGIGKKMERALEDALGDEDVSVVDRWEEWRERERGEVEGLMGRGMPRASLALVPRREAVRYACDDAEATLRLVEVLEERAKRVGMDVRG